jgi:ABC-type branched-subunit amino acid transport system permease subunit
MLSGLFAGLAGVLYAVQNEFAAPATLPAGLGGSAAGTAFSGVIEPHVTASRT